MKLSTIPTETTVQYSQSNQNFWSYEFTGI